jgi:hypothetical protein
MVIFYSFLYVYQMHLPQLGAPREIVTRGQMDSWLRTWLGATGNANQHFWFDDDDHITIRY